MILIEIIYYIIIKNYSYKPRIYKDLDFEQVTCAHLILQMNSLQSLFDFQIISLFEDEDKELPWDPVSDIG